MHFNLYSIQIASAAQNRMHRSFGFGSKGFALIRNYMPNKQFAGSNFAKTEFTGLLLIDFIAAPKSAGVRDESEACFLRFC